METVKKTYRPKSGYEGAEVTFPNPLTGETVSITSWPHETDSSVEMAHLDGHPWIKEAGSEKPLSQMTKGELAAEAERRGVSVSGDMTKAEIVEAIDAGGSE